MSRFAQGTAANNDTLFHCRNVRSIIVSENSDKRTISEELFKKLVGGDVLDVSAKFKEAVTCRFPGKLTFFQNDSPVWSSADATPIRRRIWNMPMRAQHLRFCTLHSHTATPSPLCCVRLKYPSHEQEGRRAAEEEARG